MTELRVDADNPDQSDMMLYILPHFEVNYQVGDCGMNNPRNEGSECRFFLRGKGDLFS
jgi:hypothetical protein